MDNNLTLGGYNLPKHAQIVALLQYIRSNEQYFDRPLEFDVHHFMDEEGKFQKHAAMSLFGYGRRSCPGVSLARRMIYLIVGTLILRYKFLPTKNNSTHYLKIHQSIVCVQKRD